MSANPLMQKRLCHLLLIAVIGFLAYANTFQAPFSFDDKFQIVNSPLIRGIGTFISSEKDTYAGYNQRRYVGYLTLALNYQLGGLNVTGYHVVNLAIHIVNGMLVYFLVILIFRTPYFQAMGNGQWAGGEEKRAVSSQPGRPASHPENQGHFSIPGQSRIYDPLSRLRNSGTVPGVPIFPDSRFPIHDSRFLIALFSALLFVSHPLQTQAVTYIIQRFTSLATLFYLSSVVLYVNGRLAGRQAGRLASYLLSLLAAICAMMTKEISFTLPIMLLLCEFIFFRATLKKKLLLLIPVLLALLIIAAGVLHADKPLGELMADLSARSRQQTDMPRGDYLMTQMRVIITYLRLMLFPVNQNLDYDYPIYRSFFSPSVFPSFLLLSALFGIAVYLLYKTQSKKSVVSSKKGEVADNDPNTDSLSLLTTRYSLFTVRLIAFGIFWFFLALSVESSVIPIVDVIFEHRFYLPSIGAFIAVTTALFAAAGKMEKRWPQAGKTAISLMALVVMMLSVATFARNRVWEDEVVMWEDVAKKSPGSARAHNDLGFLYNARGMHDEAIAQFLASLNLMPGYSDARINLGIAFFAKGMSDQAIEQFKTALRMSPGDANAHNNLGIAYVSMGLIAQGIEESQTALRLKPDYAEAYNNLGVAYGAQGLFDQAVQNFDQAVRLRPDYTEARYNLALSYFRKNDLARAEEEYTQLAVIDPEMAKKLLPLIQEIAKRQKSE
jgi:Flp pilus assembly protein TadD